MITSLYAALLALFYVYLSVHVIRGRTRHKVSVGDGQVESLQYAVRAQANCGEYAPLFLILLALAEMQGAAHMLLHGFGLLFVAGRLLHAHSFLHLPIGAEATRKKHLKLRQAGMMLTFFCLVALALVLAFTGASSWF